MNEEQETKTRTQSSPSQPDLSASTRETQTPESDNSASTRDTRTPKSDNSIVKIGLREDGTLDFVLNFRRQFDVSEKIGRFGGYTLFIGFLTTIIVPILYLSGFITSLSVAIAIMSAPFAIGGGLMTAASNFEYLPFVK